MRGKKITDALFALKVLMEEYKERQKEQQYVLRQIWRGGGTFNREGKGKLVGARKSICA